jgi:hypothetical protein
MEFAKAVLEEVEDGPGTKSTSGGAGIVVQINPATLRLQMASTVDFGKDTGRQKVQYQGSTSTLSFDLIFDTADEGTTESPVDVRTRTRQLERFVLPAMKKTKAVPPRVRFTYGSFSVIGVMTALNQDFDYFARNGVPLRAKCAVTIKEQRPEFDATLAGPGANTGAGAAPALPPGRDSASGTGSAVAAPGTPPPSTPPADRSGTALAGESAPDFAARMGLDPRAWKGLQGITDPLALPAGLRLDFSGALSASAGLGVDLGDAAGVPLPGGGQGGGGQGGGTSGGGGSGAGPGAAPGAPGSGGSAVPPGGVPTQAPADGTALAAAGGLTRALADAAAAGAGLAAATTRQGFVTGPDPASPAPPATVVAAPSGTTAVPAAPDPRALGYGFGVPLRPRIPVGHVVVPGLVTKRNRRAAVSGDLPPETDDPTVAGWLALRATGTTGATTGGGAR